MLNVRVGGRAEVFFVVINAVRVGPVLELDFIDNIELGPVPNRYHGLAGHQKHVHLVEKVKTD